MNWRSWLIATYLSRVWDEEYTTTTALLTPYSEESLIEVDIHVEPPAVYVAERVIQYFSTGNIV